MSDRTKTYADVKVVLKDIFGINEKDVKLESQFKEDIKSDSISFLEFIIATEEHFGIDIPDEKINAMKTVKDTVETVVEILKNPPEPVRRTKAPAPARW